MDDTKIAIIGGGLGGLSLLAGVVRAAVDQGKVHITVKIFEPGFIGPGLAYDTHTPESFKLNHEFNHMGSVNVNLKKTDPQDFFKWARSHRTILQSLYPGYDLTNPNEYVPRSMYGRYLQVRYEEIRAYAAEHGLSVRENHSKVQNIRRHDDGSFSVFSDTENERFDTVVLTTGNYFNQLDPTLAATGRYFRPSDYKYYVSEAIPDGSTILIAGTALFAYDAALYALESGKYKTVIMASRRGMLRKVRGKTAPYTRRFLTIDTLEQMAGDSAQPFRLEHLLAAVKLELEHAYGKKIEWKEGYTTQEIVDGFAYDINEVENDNELRWRSILASITDAERHQIYTRLHKQDKWLFIKKYASLYNLFLAPMPITNARKIRDYIDQGRIKIVNGMQKVEYMPKNSKFRLSYARYANDTPVANLDPAQKHPAGLTKNYPILADIYINATGIGRDITQVPLYQQLLEEGLVATNSYGGIHVDFTSQQTLEKNGKVVPGLYAIGQMTCGETVLTHNSLHLSRLGIDVGANVISKVRHRNSLFYAPVSA